ncbi:hypothetical protein GJ496_009001 [Pomphorhynchus laevis]|nr:hypothetical protein GJ496_009001 [Pomphorhynchus laevis]
MISFILLLLLSLTINGVFSNSTISNVPEQPNGYNINAVVLCYICPVQSADFNLYTTSINRTSLQQSSQCKFKESNGQCVFTFKADRNSNPRIESTTIKYNESVLELNQYRQHLPKYALELYMSNDDRDKGWSMEIQSLSYYCRSHGCNSPAHLYEVLDLRMFVNNSLNPILFEPLVNEQVKQMKSGIRCSKCLTYKINGVTTVCTFSNKHICNSYCSTYYTVNSSRGKGSWSAGCINTKNTDIGQSPLLPRKSKAECTVKLEYEPKSTKYKILEFNYICNNGDNCNNPIRINDFLTSLIISNRRNYAYQATSNILFMITCILFIYLS